MNKKLEISPLNIDRKATKNEVKKVLEKYRLFLLAEEQERHPKITSEYSLVPPSKTNKFYSSTERAAIENVDRENERSEYITTISAAVNRLDFSERAILIQRYLTKGEVYDFEVYNDLGFSERKYYRLKNRAFNNLAFALKIEVYKDS